MSLGTKTKQSNAPIWWNKNRNEDVPFQTFWWFSVVFALGMNRIIKSCGGEKMGVVNRVKKQRFHKLLGLVCNFWPQIPLVLCLLAASLEDWQ